MTLPERYFGQTVLSWRIHAMIFLAALTCGCTSVEPWQRGTLAKEQMAPNPHPLQNVLRTHVQNSREAASGGDVAAGGGCGCY